MAAYQSALVVEVRCRGVQDARIIHRERHDGAKIAETRITMKQASVCLREAA